MNQNSRAALVFFAVVLSLLQFWVVPQVQKQNALKSELMSVNEQVARLKSLVLSEPNLVEAYQQLPVFYSNLLESFPQLTPAYSSMQLKLDFQQKLQADMATENVDVTLFDWLGQDLQAGFEIYQAKIELRGKPEELLTSYYSFLNNRPNVNVLHFDYRLAATNRRQTTPQATLIALVQVIAVTPEIIAINEDF